MEKREGGSEGKREWNLLKSLVCTVTNGFPPPLYVGWLPPPLSPLYLLPCYADVANDRRYRATHPPPRSKRAASVPPLRIPRQDTEEPFYQSNRDVRFRSPSGSNRDPVRSAFSTYATAFRVLYWWRQHCKQISNGRLEIFKKIINLLTVTVLFLFTFFTLILDAPRT